MVGALDSLEPAQGVALGVPAGSRPGRKVDLDPGVGMLVADIVRGAPHPVEEVRPRPPADPVVARIADEGVVVRGADEHLETGDGVALGVAAGRGVGGEVHVDSRGGRLVGEVVPARAPVEAVRTAGAPERIAAGATNEGVAVGRADDLPEPDKGVPLGVAARHRAGRQVDGYPLIGGAVNDRVPAVAPVEGVGASITVDEVVPVAAFEGVVAAVPGEDVIEDGADDVLEAHDGIALGVPAQHRTGRKVDVDSSVGIPVIEDVIPAAAVEAVGARASLDDVGGCVADEGVGMAGADDVLEPAHRVPGGVPSAEGVGAQVDVDPGIGVRVHQHVAPAVALEPVVARPALDAVVAPVPEQGVGVAGADDVLEPGQPVPRGVPAGRPAPGRSGQIDVNTGGGGGIVDRVRPRLPVERVGARATTDRIVALAAEDGVGARSAVDAVGPIAPGDGVGARVPNEGVVVGGPLEVLEPGDDVADRIAARNGGRSQVDRNALRGAAPGVGEQVAAQAPDEGVGTLAPDDRVGAAARVDMVGAQPAFDAVGAAGKDAARTIAEDPVGAGAPEEGVVAGPADEPVAPVPTLDAVVVGTAVEEVGSAAAKKSVVAAQTGEPVATGAALDAVAARGARTSRHGPSP